MSNPIPLNASTGLLATLSKCYEMLTDTFIQQWMYELMLEYRASPQYLLVPSEQVRQELRHTLINDFRVIWHLYREEEHDALWRGERYPNKASNTYLTIVVFPGIPEKTLVVADVLEVREESLRMNGIVQTTLRTYGRLGEEQEAEKVGD